MGKVLVNFRLREKYATWYLSFLPDSLMKVVISLGDDVVALRPAHPVDASFQDRETLQVLSVERQCQKGSPVMSPV